MSEQERKLYDESKQREDFPPLNFDLRVDSVEKLAELLDEIGWRAWQARAALAQQAVPVKCVMPPKNVDLTISIDTSPIAAEIAELQRQAEHIAAAPQAEKAFTSQPLGGTIGTRIANILYYAEKLREQTGAETEEEGWCVRIIHSIEYLRAALAAQQAEREPLSRAQAIAIARKAAVAARDESGNPTHSYLPMDSGENWEPHEWVVDAIMAAGGIGKEGGQWMTA